MVFLCIPKQILPDEFFKAIFKYSTRQPVSQATKSLMLCFAKDIRLTSFTRDELKARHVRHLQISCVTLNQIYRKLSFALMGHILIYQKAALIVAPDRYILEIHGPYSSDSRNNDTEILHARISS